MHQDLPGIDRREEIPAKERHQQERGPDKRQEPGDEDAAMRQRHVQQSAIAGAELVKTGFEAALKANQRIP